MQIKKLFILLLLFTIPGLSLVPDGRAQTENTWLRFDGGYLQQAINPLSAHPPVHQEDQGYGLGVGLYYDLGDIYHYGEVNYHSQQANRLYPADIPAASDEYISLSLAYQFTKFHFRNVGDTHVDLGSGPYLFVNDQTNYYPAVDEPPVESGSVLYGGGINLVIRYQNPDIPLSGRIYWVNGGFLGSQEVSRDNETFSSTSLNGWFSEINLEAGYRLASDWRVYLSYQISERLEYRSPVSQRRTFQHVTFGISYRLEDD